MIHRSLIKTKLHLTGIFLWQSQFVNGATITQLALSQIPSPAAAAQSSGQNTPPQSQSSPKISFDATNPLYPQRRLSEDRKYVLPLYMLNSNERRALFQSLYQAMQNLPSGSERPSITMSGLGGETVHFSRSDEDDLILKWKKDNETLFQVNLSRAGSARSGTIDLCTSENCVEISQLDAILNTADAFRLLELETQELPVNEMDLLRPYLPICELCMKTIPGVAVDQSLSFSQVYAQQILTATSSFQDFDYWTDLYNPNAAEKDSIYSLGAKKEGSKLTLSVIKSSERSKTRNSLSTRKFNLSWDQNSPGILNLTLEKTDDPSTRFFDGIKIQGLSSIEVNFNASPPVVRISVQKKEVLQTFCCPILANGEVFDPSYTKTEEPFISLEDAKACLRYVTKCLVRIKTLTTHQNSLTSAQLSDVVRPMNFQSNPPHGYLLNARYPGSSDENLEYSIRTRLEAKAGGFLLSMGKKQEAEKKRADVNSSVAASPAVLASQSYPSESGTAEHLLGAAPTATSSSAGVTNIELQKLVSRCETFNSNHEHTNAVIKYVAKWLKNMGQGKMTKEEVLKRVQRGLDSAKLPSEDNLIRVQAEGENILSDCLKFLTSQS